MNALTWPTERATRDALDDVPHVVVGYSSKPEVPEFMRVGVDLELVEKASDDVGVRIESSE